MLNLLKNEAEFLMAAVDPKGTRSHLRYILATDTGWLATTDGFRAHIIPTPNVEPGFYMYDKGSKQTLRIPDENISGSREYHSKYYLMKNFGLDGIYKGALDQAKEPLMMYSAKLGDLDCFSADRYPRTKTVGDSTGNPRSIMTFKRGIVAGEMRAICLGTNALPLVWKEDGNVEIDREGCMTLENNYVLDAMAGGMTRPVMRWGDSWRPAIIGDIDGPHVIIMPISVPRN